MHDGETDLGPCIVCGHRIIDRSHEHHWKHVPEWNGTICKMCATFNRDGIVLEARPRLVKHLRESGVEIHLNDKGTLDIP